MKFHLLSEIQVVVIFIAKNQKKNTQRRIGNRANFHRFYRILQQSARMNVIRTTSYSHGRHLPKAVVLDEDGDLLGTQCHGATESWFQVGSISKSSTS